ncbi:class I SAM-dependent methyltransferase [Facklamia lactis]|uniref:class I SAM-dependent methyltransferase n=1 Tax=Facklamia lactis TaxID=2749967 RepID=UPI0018CD2CAC|nr:class I SAM-dependent methyltransferase [Facklamia lactis]MBG9980355.1 class I SAM-dependent methyltransferase [Facklamia lactis]
MDYTKINAETIDRWVDEGWQWGQAISREAYQQVKNREWQMLLTPTKAVPKNWFGDLKGKKVLGLASGGGQQMPIFAALGADVTVFDYSTRQLDQERLVAEREGYSIRIIQGDMTKPLPFENETFDLIFHPVSNCYVEEVLPIWQECYRILRVDGILLSGLDNGINYMVDETEERIVHSLPFNPMYNKEQMKFLKENDSGIQFSHTLTEQIGGQIQAGFVLIDLYEDTNGEGRLHDLNIPSFWATRSLKVKH